MLVRGPIIAHLTLMAMFAASADVNTPGTLWVGALAYALLQGGRALHEVTHAWIGQRSGLEVRQIRLGVLRMAVDFSADAVWSAKPRARRATAAAGAVVQALFGALLIAGAAMRSSSHAAEPVMLIGLLHLTALTNLLPVAGSDGEYLFGRAFQARLGWLVLVPVVMIQVAVPMIATATAFPVGFAHALATTFLRPSEVLYAMVALIIAPPLTQRLINVANGVDSRAYSSASSRGVR